jgi:hypothetical protein
MSAQYNALTIVNSLLASSAGLVFLFLADLGVIGERGSFLAVNLILLVYLWLEVRFVRRLQPHQWLISPVVLCSILTFGVGYSLSNFLYFMPEVYTAGLGFKPIITPNMVKLMYLVLLSAVCLWLGYWSPVAMRLSRPAVVVKFQRRFLPASYRVRPRAVPLLFVLSVLTRIAGIKLGIFGYSSNPNALIDAAAYSQYLAMLGGLGKLALVLAALQYYRGAKKPGAKKNRFAIWLVITLITELAFGFLSGFKSAVALPFVIVGLCRYLAVGRLPISWIGLMFFGLYVAYLVIEPFRAERSRQAALIETSVTAIATSLIDNAVKQPSDSEYSRQITLKIASRANLTYVGSLGIDYLDSHADLPPSSPKFLEHLLLAPLHALVPRIIWSSKPLGDYGHWYTRVIFGRALSMSATASGPITYLYFAGGSLAISLFFFALGILQRVIFALLSPATNIAGALVFFGMLSTLTQISSSVNGIVVALFRELPLLILFLSALFWRPPRHAANTSALPQLPEIDRA